MDYGLRGGHIYGIRITGGSYLRNTEYGIKSDPGGNPGISSDPGGNPETKNNKKKQNKKKTKKEQQQLRPCFFMTGHLNRDKNT